MAGPSVSDLVEAAGRGDQAAWNDLVAQHSPLVWAIVRRHRLRPGDAEDAFQTTWLRLLENLDRLDAPERLASWLATTARRECLRVLRHGNREVPVLDVGDHAERTAGAVGEPVEALLSREEQIEVHRAFRRLSQRCQDLLRVTVFVPKPEYASVAETLGMPVGSIGPTRGRCLRHLRRLLGENDEGGSS